MADESPKLRRLRAIREQLATGRMTERERKAAVIADTNGATVRLSDPDALAALDRRIDAEASIDP